MSGTNSSYTSVSPADYDGDGDTDIFIGTYSSETSIFYLENLGNNTFADSVAWLKENNYYGSYVKAGDFNKDGRPDLISPQHRKLKVYINKGNFEFDTLKVGEGLQSDSSELAMVDIDRDGDNDFIQSSYSNIYIYEQLLNQQFTEPQPLLLENDFYYVSNFILMDKEGDGDTDIVANIDNKVYFLENQGSGLFSEPQVQSFGTYMNYLIGMDLNQNNLTDLVFSRYNEGVFWCENTDRPMNQVSGKLYIDKNANCTFDSEDAPLQHQLVKVSPGPFYSMADSSGTYTLTLDTGNYQIESLVSINKDKLITYCKTNEELAISDPGSEITGINFGVQVKECPELHVNISSIRRRRCFSSMTSVNYKNTGNAPAESVKVKVVYPQYVHLKSASKEYTTEDDSVYIFEIGDLRPHESGSISIADSVICGIEAIRGLTQCTKAYISTPTLCTPQYIPEGWDKSSISVTGNCNTDEGRVNFIIKNGDDSGDMADSSSYRVFYNDTLVYSASFKLQASEELPVSVPVYGQTVRLEAQQHPQHPGKSLPREIIEACGVNLESASRGFVTTVPQDDNDEIVDISCLPIIDSYDPNDKQAEPSGYGPDNYIRPGERIEYTIRFQNTGTDTAYKVVVVDTLRAPFDMSSLKLLGTSHKHTVSISGEETPVITWVFNDIMLPDSTTNEPESNGFIKFSIVTDESLAEGTLIENFADIFFDYNSAIRTNTYTHEINYFIPEDRSKGIGINEPVLSTTTGKSLEIARVKIYPNPFSEKLFFTVNTTSAYTIQLFSQLGEKVKEIQNISSQEFAIEDIDLKPGIYMYKISSEEGEIIATGKVIAEE